MNKGAAILLVEDDADDAYFVSRAVRAAGLDVPLEVANDGQAAIDYLAAAVERRERGDGAQPCLILLDLNLPRKSGLEVLKWIRSAANWKTMIVIVLTSSTSEADMNAAYSLGANSYLVKPSDATKLTELGQLLKGYWFGWNQMPPMCREVATAHVGL